MSFPVIRKVFSANNPPLITDYSRYLCILVEQIIDTNNFFQIMQCANYINFAVKSNIKYKRSTKIGGI